MINAAIIGLGRWGRRLVDSVQEDGNPKCGAIRFTRAVVTDSSKSADYAARQHLAFAGSLSEVLTDDRIDAVVLATPHELHSAQIIQVLAAGKHVFVEKPFTLTFSEAERAIAAARAADRVLAVGFNRRFLPAAARLKAHLASPEFGALVHLEGTFCNNSGLAYRPDMWRAKEGGPKSAMTAMGMHVLDFLIMLAGPVRSVRTSSVRQRMPVAVDDIVCVDLTFRSGLPAKLTTMLSTPRQWRIQAYGTGQWAEMSDEHVLNLSDGSASLGTTTFDIVDTVRLELEAFAGAVQGGPAYPISTDEALAGVAAFEAILISAAAGGAEVDLAVVERG